MYSLYRRFFLLGTKAAVSRIQPTAMKTLLQFAAIAALGTSVLYGQNVDTSGNSMLKGAYRFRQVAVLNISSTTGSPTDVVCPNRDADTVGLPGSQTDVAGPPPGGTDRRL